MRESLCFEKCYFSIQTRFFLMLFSNLSNTAGSSGASQVFIAKAMTNSATSSILLLNKNVAHFSVLN